MGQALKAGDILEVEDSSVNLPWNTPLPGDLIPDYSLRPDLRVILGPQEDRFSPQGLETFLTSEYTVSPQSDRMGYRLEGPRIEHLQGADIIPAPIARGAVQVPGDGLPIIMLWDAQVSGGYTKIATVITADHDLLGQTMPGERLRFKKVTLDEAQAALRSQEIRLAEAERAIAG